MAEGGNWTEKRAFQRVEKSYIDGGASPSRHLSRVDVVHGKLDCTEKYFASKRFSSPILQNRE